MTPFDEIKISENTDNSSKVIEDLLYLLLEAYLEEARSSRAVEKKENKK